MGTESIFNRNKIFSLSPFYRAVTDPRDGKRVALKKMPNVFQNILSSIRVYREIKMMLFFKHENVLSALDIIQPPHITYFHEVYIITELMSSDLHKIIVSSQPLTTDHVKIFLYQILRGLKYLHSANILHRDIKPGNLLVNSNCLLKVTIIIIQHIFPYPFLSLCYLRIPKLVSFS